MGWFANMLFGKPEESTLDKSTPTPEISSAPQSSGDSEEDSYRGTTGTKVIPEVVIDQLEARLSSDMERVELWARLYNQSSFEVEVRKFEMLGQQTDPGQFLKANEKRQIRVYDGETPQNDSDKKALVQYRIRGNGDYFQSDHIIVYRREGEHCIPYELRIIRPVRDI